MKVTSLGIVSVNVSPGLIVTLSGIVISLYFTLKPAYLLFPLGNCKSTDGFVTEIFVPSFVTSEFVTTGASVEGVVAVVVISVVSGATVVTCVVSGAVVVGASVVSEAYTPCDVKSAKRMALDVINFLFIFV